MHYKQNNKESKTYVQGLRLFGNTLPRGIKGILKKNGYNYSEIVGKWNTIINRDISKFCYPKSIKISKNKTAGTLILSVKRGNELDVEYSKNDIMEKINSYFGYKFIENIKLENSNSEIKKKKNKNIKFNKNYLKKINEIKNDKIRKSLQELLGTINDE
tara:strand:- start:1240 stop:1716 length:477 start_codon:yes stop_codon:yes gene_type:complete